MEPTAIPEPQHQAVHAHATRSREDPRGRLWHPLLLLLIGAGLTICSDMRGGAGIFAWFAPIPFLLHAAVFTRWTDRAWLLAVLVLAFGLMFAKQISPPVVYSAPFGLLVAVLTAVKFAIAYIGWGAIRRRGGHWAGILAFPAILVSLEYIQAYATPFGVWGALANTQVFNLTLLQTASLTGFLGITALIAWGAALMAALVLDAKIRGKAGHVAIFAAVVGALHVYGDSRLDRSTPGSSVHTAAVVSDLAPPTGTPDPSDPAVKQATEAMLARTARAAKNGASHVVWSEAATFVAPESEAAFQERVAKVARTQDISIVAAYAVAPPSRDGESDAAFENTYVWVRPNGTVAQTYTKHHPVPGEGSVPGTAPLRAIDTSHGRMAGAICYDYDFPRMAQRHADLGARLVALPGLDWRGMRRRHSYMARMRAIEGGFALVRSVSGAVSMAVDGYGRIRAAQSDFAETDNIMLAELPVGPVETLYSRIGNVVAYAAIIGVIVAVGAAVRGDRARKRPSEDPRHP